MEPCEESAEIAQKIVSGGGEMTRRYESESIEIVPCPISMRGQEDILKNHPVYSYEFIHDSVNLRELQDLKDYIINPEENAAKPAGRTKYTKSDIEKMKNYYSSNRGRASNAKYWEMALERGLDVNHSSESLKYYWCKHLANSAHSNKKIEFEPPKKVKIIDLSQGVCDTGIQVDEMSNLPPNITLQDKALIDKKFLDLVSMCKALAKKDISEREIAKRLIDLQGNVKNTLLSYKFFP